MRRSLAPALVAAIAALLIAASAGTGAAAVSGRCGPSTAKRLIGTLPIARQAAPFSGLGQTICTDFTGDGRSDIVLTAWTAMNHGAHYWAAFRGTSGNHWVRVAFYGDCCGASARNGGLGIAVHMRGRQIVVSQPVYRSSDPLCCPSGGKRSAVWAWAKGRLHIVGR